MNDGEAEILLSGAPAEDYAALAAEVEAATRDVCVSLVPGGYEHNCLQYVDGVDILAPTIDSPLEGGESVPCSGDNFEAFATTACVMGRNYLHPLVVETVVDAYGILSEREPDRVWQYGDLGWESGGSFKPHKTHQNGLSAML